MDKVEILEEQVACPCCGGQGFDVRPVCCGRGYAECCGEPDPEQVPCEYCNTYGWVDSKQYTIDKLKGLVQ